MAKSNFRVIVGGVGLDLGRAFAEAPVEAWAELQRYNKHNPFTVGKKFRLLEKLKGVAAEEAFEQLAGDEGSDLTLLIGDLVFLARRMNGEREQGTDRPLSAATSFRTTPFFEALGMLGAGDAEEAEEEPDPTRAATPPSGPAG